MNDHQSNVIVVGGGIAGLTVASAVADLGLSVTLAEQQRRLGGHAADWACMATDQCARCSACMVQEQIARVAAHPNIEILTGACVAACEGQADDWRVTLEPVEAPELARDPHPGWRLSEPRTVPARAVVLATGFEPFDAANAPLLGYDRFDQVVTTQDLDRLLREDNLADFAPEDDTPLRVAFIQCVGSRDRKSGREYCSQFCCRTTIRLVQRLQHLRPKLEATVFYIDLQVMSKEFGVFFERARDSVGFIQGVPAEVCPGETPGTVRLYGVTPGADRAQALEFDRVVLAIGLAPADSHRALAQVMGLELNEFGCFAASDPATPLQTSRAGVYLAGACAGPADILGSRRQALAVAGVLAGRLAADGRCETAAPVASEAATT